jgi:ASC-1-like (ASCH) protein
MPKRGLPETEPVTWSCDHESLQQARERGMWLDGTPVGRGHGSPCLQRHYAEQIVAGVKKVEGRAWTGFATKVSRGDWLNFFVAGTGGARLLCRVLDVHRHASFQKMLESHGIEACLPGTVSMEAAVQTYREIRTGAGESYASLESSEGVVAFVMSPLLVQTVPRTTSARRRPRWKAGVLRVV